MMLSEMPHRPRHVPVGTDYVDDDHLHEGHVWDCRGCVRTNPSLDLGVRGCWRCTHRGWTPEENDSGVRPHGYRERERDQAARDGLRAAGLAGSYPRDPSLDPDWDQDVDGYGERPR